MGRAGKLKAEIYRLLRSLARDGVSILMSSSDIEDYVWNGARVGSRHRISRRIRDLQVHQRGTQRLAVRVERQ